MRNYKRLYRLQTKFSNEFQSVPILLSTNSISKFEFRCLLPQFSRESKKFTLNESRRGSPAIENDRRLECKGTPATAAFVPLFFNAILRCTLGID